MFVFVVKFASLHEDAPWSLEGIFRTEQGAQMYIDKMAEKYGLPKRCWMISRHRVLEEGEIYE